MSTIRKEEIALVVPNAPGSYSRDSQTASNSYEAAPSSSTDVFKSPNCANGERETVLFTYFAHTDTENISRNMISCQTSDFGVPDTLTKVHMQNVAAEKLASNVDDVMIESHGIRLFPRETKDRAKDVVERRMAFNCAPHYDLSKITSYNRFECNYIGTGKDEKGRIIMNPYQSWKGVLPSCDNTLEISDELEQDIRTVAYDAAGGDEAEMDINKFLCKITSIPI